MLCALQWSNILSHVSGITSWNSFQISCALYILWWWHSIWMALMNFKPIRIVMFRGKQTILELWQGCLLFLVIKRPKGQFNCNAIRTRTIGKSVAKTNIAFKQISQSSTEYLFNFILLLEKFVERFVWIIENDYHLLLIPSFAPLMLRQNRLDCDTHFSLISQISNRASQ